MKRDTLPRSVFPKGRWFYLVTADGKKRIWHPLSLIKDGLPALYTALAAAKTQAAGVGKVPELISAWEREVMPAHAEKTQRDEKARGRVIAEALVEFLPADVQTPDCSEFLAQFRAKPRTFNAYRAQLREYMRFAEEKGQRPAGSNPIQAVRTMATPAPCDSRTAIRSDRQSPRTAPPPRECRSTSPPGLWCACRSGSSRQGARQADACQGRQARPGRRSQRPPPRQAGSPPSLVSAVALGL